MVSLLHDRKKIALSGISQTLISGLTLIMYRGRLLTISLFCMTSGLYAQVKDHDKVSLEDTIRPYVPEAVYNGKLKELAKTLEKKYTEKKPRPSGDSSVAFKAFVNKQSLNDLQEIELIEEPKSAFSDFILQGLRESGKAWRPMLQGGRKVKSIIWVCARLNSDGSITLTTGNYIGR